MSTPEIITQVADDAFEALVSKGIHAMLFPLKRVGNAIQVDTSKNILYRCPVGTFNTSGDTVEMEELQDQIRGGNYKTKIAGQTDPGDITLDTYFDPVRGKPDIQGVVNSMVFTPQFLLILARKKDSTTLQGFLSGGVNYAGGNDIKGDLGKAIRSSLKFAFSGEPKFGYEAVGTIPMSLYEAGGDTTVASAGSIQSLLNSVLPGGETTDGSQQTKEFIA